MKIQTILQEDFNPNLETQSVKFSDLTTPQVRTLRRIASGQVDIESASDAEYDIIAELADLGLLDQDYQLTNRGNNAVAIANKLGGSAEYVAAKRRQEKLNTQDRSNKPDGNPMNTDMDPDGMDPDDGEGDEFDFNVDNSMDSGMNTNRGRLNF